MRMETTGNKKMKFIKIKVMKFIYFFEKYFKKEK